MKKFLIPMGFVWVLVAFMIGVMIMLLPGSSYRIITIGKPRFPIVNDTQTPAGEKDTSDTVKTKVKILGTDPNNMVTTKVQIVE